MTAHGVLLSVTAAIACLYAGWWVGERTGDGPLVGWILAALVLVSCLLLDAGV